MGFRVRKSIKIAPGVKLNLGKKSVGISVGGKGGHVTVNSKGRVSSSVGIPGTGISYSTSTQVGKRASRPAISKSANYPSSTTTVDSINRGSDPMFFILLLFVGAIFAILVGLLVLLFSKQVGLIVLLIGGALLLIAVLCREKALTIYNKDHPEN